MAKELNKSNGAQKSGNGRVATKASSGPKKYTAPIVCIPHTLPDEFVGLVRELEGILKMPVWLFVQKPPENPQEEALQSVHPHVLVHWESCIQLMPDSPVALLIHSLGGDAATAFQLSLLLQDRCHGFTAVIPRYAKSAATLLALGAKEILLGRPPAELGPLDAQIQDHEREQIVSALDEVQALERLRAFALDTFDNTMNLFLERTSKKLSTLFPMVMTFTADVARPLFEKVDVVRYTQMSRGLKVAEDYAARCLLGKYSEQEAESIAGYLAEQYSEHGFPITIAETLYIKSQLGFERRLAELPPAGAQHIFDKMLPFLGTFTAIGPLMEVQVNGQAS